MSCYHETFGTIVVHQSDLATIGCDLSAWPWNQPELAAGVTAAIVSDSCVNGGGPRVVAEIGGCEVAIVRGSESLARLLGVGHPALVASRNATASAIAEQRNFGRAEAAMIQAARRL